MTVHKIYLFYKHIKREVSLELSFLESLTKKKCDDFYSFTYSGSII